MMLKLVRIVVGVLDALGARIRPNPEQMPAHLITGKRGEDAAYFYLRELGYVIIARNWRSRRRKGEIDLIGWDGDVLCFIEVKTRSTREVKPAEAAVDREKRGELVEMAREYLWRVARSSGKASREPATKPSGTSSELVSRRVCRFDIVSVYYEGQREEPTDIALFRNSFSMT
jgi:putative endonuclease